MKKQRIRTSLEKYHPGLKIGGWLNGTHTYLWFAKDSNYLGVLEGQKLYRLAKAIVRHMESGRRDK